MGSGVNTYLLVGAGGAIGSMARLGVYRLLPAPWGTLGVNIAGSLLMGLLVGVLAARGTIAEGPRLLLGVGVLGGFTTFSAFSLDAAQMLQRGAWGGAMAYALGSVLLAVAALFAGLLLGRALA